MSLSTLHSTYIALTETPETVLEQLREPDVEDRTRIECWATSSSILGTGGKKRSDSSCDL
jgi:hypothetical protein